MISSQYRQRIINDLRLRARKVLINGEIEATIVNVQTTGSHIIFYTNLMNEVSRIHSFLLLDENNMAILERTRAVDVTSNRSLQFRIEIEVR